MLQPHPGSVHGCGTNNRMQLRLTPLRNPVLLLGAVLAALALLTGPASGDASQYPTTLYLSGAPSALVPTSFQLVGTAGPSTPATPTAANVVGAGSLTGTYNYIVVAGGSSGPDTASLISNSAVPASQNITVGNLPSGTAVDIYRQKSGQAAGVSSPFYYVGNSGGATTYVDSLSDASAALNRVLPEASNRITTLFSSTCAATTCGYLDFSPGVEPAPGSSANLTPPTLAASPSTTPNNKGWIVDGAGSVTIPAGSWTFQVRTKNSNANGVAHLVVGVWKVTTSGGAIATATAILAPNCTGVNTPAGCPGNAENTATNLVTAGAAVQTVTYSVSLPLISLAAGDHLYVQFWRRQTTPYSNGSGTNHLVTMMAYDSLAQITLPAASTFPNAPTLVSPADATPTNVPPQLKATFSDPDAGDTGTVTFNVCSDSACAHVVTSATSSSVSNNANASWTPASLPAEGTYYWQAKDTDAAGGVSSWTATQSFIYDTTPPDTTIGTGPANPNNSTSATFSFTATEAGSSFKCQLDGGGFSTCVSPMSYNGLADGSHTFQVEATDPAGNTDLSPASSTWTVDTVTPVTTITASPANLTTATSASFSFGANKAGSTFQCKLDSASFAACTSPAAYSGLADGSHTFQVKATDTAGNTGSASYSWTVDTTPPVATITASPASASNLTSASFAFSANETGSTFACKLDDGAFATCTGTGSYSGLAEGSHTFQLQATDPAGNTSSISFSWTVDTTPPKTTITASPLSLNNSTDAEIAFGSNEDGSSFQCSLDGGNPAPCSSPATYSGLGEGTHTFSVQATDAAGNADPTPQVATWTVDTTPPKTTITAGPANPTNATSANFAFSANEDATFECSLDGAIMASCASPAVYSGLADGSHTFQVVATDAAGNTDPTVASQSWTIQHTPPGAPGSFAGTLGADGLTLNWTAPGAGQIAQYLVYVDGTVAMHVDGTSTSVKVGPFGADDSRTFAVSAVDAAGNESPRTATLTGVPNLAGLRLSEAEAALQARGLVIAKQALNASSAAALVVAQRPAPATLVPVQSTVFVTFAQPPAPSSSSSAGSSVFAPLAVHIAGAQAVSCTQSSRLTLQIQLDRQANVAVRFLTAAGVPVDSVRLVPIRAGARTLKLRLPAGLLDRKSYRVVVTATTGGQIVRAEIKLTIVRAGVRSAASARTCG